MRVAIHSERLSPGCLPTWDFIEPSDCYYVASDGESIKKVGGARRVTAEEFEISAAESDKRKIARKAREMIACLAESAGAAGTAIVGVRTDMTTVGGGDGTMSFVQLTMLFVPVEMAEDLIHRHVQWLPSSIWVDDDFWRELDNMEIVEEILES